MGLTESFAMTPAASVAGFYLAHPEARYFAISKIDRDQLEDWAQRAHYPVSEAEKWLARCYVRSTPCRRPAYEAPELQ
jgi:5-methyltetrahydrofolate--homocysteine methyltransferase